MADMLTTIPTALPGLRVIRAVIDTPREGLKEHYGVGRIEHGKSEWWGSGKVWRSSPGMIRVKQPGDVHRDLALDGPTTFTVVTLPMHDVTRVQDEGRALALAQLEVADQRAAPFHRLIDAALGGADRLALEVAVAEAVGAFAMISSARPDHSRPVKRAVAFIREQLAESITLDDLALHAGLDKFHLCRAFRAQVGMPPHTYLTHLRICRAKELLMQGVRASDVASMIGMYDQAQLTRHFRRLVGTTPARFGKQTSQSRQISTASDSVAPGASSSNDG